MRRGLTATGALHPHAAWERFAVPSEWPSWSPLIRYVECGRDRRAPGLTGRVHGLSRWWRFAGWCGPKPPREVLRSAPILRGRQGTRPHTALLVRLDQASRLEEMDVLHLH